MNIFDTILIIALAIGFIASIIFILFGQITVRKLRKNPKTKDKLGIEFISGWEILNAAQALALPNSIARKLKNSPLSALHADKDTFKKHTNKFDRILATIFYVLFLSSGVPLAFIGLLNFVGFFD